MREAASLAERLDDPWLVAATYFGFGELELALGKTAEAHTLIEAALRATSESARPSGSVGATTTWVGWRSPRATWSARARHHFKSALQLSRSNGGDEWLSTHALAATAPVTVLLGEPERGFAHRRRGDCRSASQPDRSALVMALLRAGESAVAAGANRHAAQVLEELLVLVCDLGTRRWLTDALELAALVLEAQGEQHVAVQVLGASEALRELAREPQGGVRTTAQEVGRGRDRLAVAPTNNFADHLALGRALTPTAAIAQALSALSSGTSP